MESRLKRVISLIEGYKKAESMYFLSSKNRIENLLTGYKMAKASLFDRFTSFLTEFKNKNDEYTKTMTSRFQILLEDYVKTLKKLRDSQKQSADEINILDVLGFTYDEIRHSKFLAYLFDPLETHAQGSLFFEIFLSEINLPFEYTQVEYRVKPEVQYEESRIDIEIISKRGGAQGFIIHIENKVGAMPYREQIVRENRTLQKKADSMDIPNERRHGFLLSPEKPDEDLLVRTLFKWIGWDIIAKCLENFINAAQAEKAKWAAEQYLECIRKNIIKIK